MPPSENFISPTGQAVTPAQLAIGRYTVTAHEDTQRFNNWFVKRPAAIPGGDLVIEAICNDRAAACRVAGALAVVDAVRHLMPWLNILHDENRVPSNARAYLDEVTMALRFIRAQP